MKIALLALTCASLTVTDGDTVKCDGVAYRLLGYDTPETCIRRGCPQGARPKCGAEYDLGMKAKARLVELIESGRPRLIWSGRRGKYRPLAWLYVDGVDVKDTLIREKLARSLDWEAGERRRSWCR